MSTYVDMLSKSGLTPRRTIFEIGGHDGTDSVALHEAYGVPVYAFEPNPEAVTLWKQNAGNRNGIHLVERAVSETNGNVSFFAIDKQKYGNIGASGLSRIDFSRRPKSDPDHGLGEIQNEITVASTRLDTFIGETGIQPDALCLDCQESELAVLRSMGDRLRDVDFVVVESTFTPTYEDGCSFPDVKSYLNHHGLRFLTSSIGAKPRRPWFRRRRFSFFDSVFVRV
jgi:FkbM family methyltransferase